MIDLLTAREAAAELRCSTRDFRKLVASGALRYVQTGVSKIRPKKMFTRDDLQAFIADRTRRESPPCQLASRRATRFTTTNSSGEVIGFAARLAREAAEKRKPSSGPKRNG